MREEMKKNIAYDDEDPCPAIFTGCASHVSDAIG